MNGEAEMMEKENFESVVSRQDTAFNERKDNISILHHNSTYIYALCEHGTKRMKMKRDERAIQTPSW